MITSDKTTSDITKRIFREVARLSWNGQLEQQKEFLPETIIPGPLPQFRCCIYREREIIRERVRSGMANAKAKGRRIGRPHVTIDDIPPAFLRHYPSYRAGKMNLSELARICKLSRTTVYKYIALLD